MTPQPTVQGMAADLARPEQVDNRPPTKSLINFTTIFYQKAPREVIPRRYHFCVVSTIRIVLLYYFFRLFNVVFMYLLHGLLLVFVVNDVALCIKYVFLASPRLLGSYCAIILI